MRQNQEALRPRIPNVPFSRVNDLPGQPYAIERPCNVSVFLIVWTTGIAEPLSESESSCLI